MSGRPALADRLEELERELSALLTRLRDPDADPRRWREEARRWSRRSRELPSWLAGARLDGDLRSRLESLVRLNAIARQSLASTLEETTRSIGCVRRARKHLAERGDGETAARSCDVSA